MNQPATHADDEKDESERAGKPEETNENAEPREIDGVRLAEIVSHLPQRLVAEHVAEARPSIVQDATPVGVLRLTERLEHSLHGRKRHDEHLLAPLGQVLEIHVMRRLFVQHERV